MKADQIKLKWHRTPIDRDKLVLLTKRRNLRPLVDNIAQLGFSALTAGAAVYAFRNLSWPWMVLFTFIHCTFYGVYGAAGNHELCHRTVFKSKWLNEFFLRIHDFLNWYDFVSFRRSHTGHHKYTVHGDLDHEVMLPQTLHWYQWVLSLTIDLLIILRLPRKWIRRAFRRRYDKIFLTVWERRIFPEDDIEGIRATRRWARIMLIGHGALITVFIITGYWYLILLVTFGHFVAMWYKILTHMPQHLGLRSGVADWRQSTRTYIADPISRFFYWNMNYHAEHHMFAAVPYYNLPKLRKEIEWDLPKASKGLIGTWIELFKVMKLQKADRSYYISPELPEGATPYLEPSFEEKATKY